MRAELDAVICSGPRRGNQLTYALLEERVPPAQGRSIATPRSPSSRDGTSPATGRRR